MSTFFLIGIAVMAGVAITLQAQFMGLLDRSLGTLTGVFIIRGARQSAVALGCQCPFIDVLGQDRADRVGQDHVDVRRVLREILAEASDRAARAHAEDDRKFGACRTPAGSIIAVKPMVGSTSAPVSGLT